MAVKRLFPPRSIEATDIELRRVEPGYTKVLLRLLAAHALAEELTAQGYERVLGTLADGELRLVAEKNMVEERRHAALIYRALEELGVGKAAANRMMITALKAPSFAAPRYFAEHAAGEMDLMMAAVSIDMSGLLMIGVNYLESSYAPHCRAAELIMEEESDHDLFAAEILRGATEKLGPEAVNQGLREWLPRAVNFFGPPGSGFSYDCIRLGLKNKDNQELADLYLAMLERRVAQLGLEMPALSVTYPHQLM